MELRGNSTKALLLAGANTLVRGWLYHKTADAGWKQVYCVPESVLGAEQVGAAPQLSVYRDAQCTQKAGVIAVEGSTVYLCSSLVPFDTQAPTPHGFAIVRNDFDAIFFFTTATAADRDLWVATLSRHLYPAERVAGVKAKWAKSAATVRSSIAAPGQAAARRNPFGATASPPLRGAGVRGGAGAAAEVGGANHVPAAKQSAGTSPSPLTSSLKKKAPVPPPRSPKLARGSPKAPPRKHRPPPRPPQSPLVEGVAITSTSAANAAAFARQTQSPAPVLLPSNLAIKKKKAVALPLPSNPFAATATATATAMTNPFATLPPVAPRRNKRSKDTNTNPFA